jgi:ABC-type transporter Mla subunit MlaD
MRSNKNNLIAGLFVVLGIFGFVATIVLLKGVGTLFTSRTPYTIEFSLQDGATGLKEGSAVRVGGKEAGVVRKVEYVTDPVNNAPIAINVAIGIRSDLTIFNDAMVQLELPLLGTVSTINVPNVGTPGSGKLEAGGKIKGELAPPPFLAQAGIGSQQRTQIQQFLKSASAIGPSAQETFDRINAVVGRVEPQIEPMVKDLRDTVASVRTGSESLSKRLDEWSPRISATIANVESFSAKLEASRALVDAGLERARSFIDDVQSLVRDNRPRVDSIMKNADQAVAKANNQLFADVQATLVDGRAALSQFAQATARIDSLVAESTPSIRLSVANARLASDQLKLMLGEVRRNPWRLLYQPGRKELEREIVYDSARAYAQAVSDLRGTTASLEAAIAATNAGDSAAGGAIRTIDQNALKDLQQSLTESFSKYREAEQKFLQLMLGDSSALQSEPSPTKSAAPGN